MTTTTLNGRKKTHVVQRNRKERRKKRTGKEQEAKEFDVEIGYKG